MSKVAAAVCYVCGKEFEKERYCNRHIKNIHKIDKTGEPIQETPAVKFECAVCGKQFSQKSTLRRHTNAVHSSERKESETELKCDQCDFKTVHRSNLKRHWLKIHQSDKSVQTKQFKCSMCSAKYKALRNLKYHERKSHKLGTISQIKRKCPLCKYTSLERSKEAIYKHFRIDHGIILNCQSHNFNCVSDFKSWKKNLEQESSIYYSKSYETKQQLHYVCHRSGNYVTKGANIRRLKSVGSCKINGFCPSYIKVKIEDTSVKVLYMPTHIGHETDPKYVRPSCGGLGGGRKYRRAMRGIRETKHSSLAKKDIHESEVLVAVINENDGIIANVANEVVVEERSSSPELNDNTAFDNNATNPNSYNEDEDTMLYLEKVKLFQELREFEWFLQKNVTSLGQINYVRGEIVKISTDINATNSSLNME